jgi:DNA mismatch repair protein MSH2
VAAILSQLDVLLSFADLSVNAALPYVRPNMTPSNEGDVVLVGSRHPCVEVQDDVSFIANDCRLVRCLLLSLLAARFTLLSAICDGRTGGCW